MPKINRSAPDYRGFTLIEVLVALAVIAIALSAIIRTTGVMTRNAVHLKEKTQAHWIAKNRISELRATRDWPAIGTTRERVILFGQEWEWIQKISELALTEDIREIEISVIRASDGDEDQPVSTLTGFLLNPDVISQQSVPTISGSGNPNDPNNFNDPAQDDSTNGSESP